MAALSRCLLLLLPALSMVVSRPSTIIVIGSIDYDPWWRTREAIELRNAIERAKQAGDFAEAETLSGRGLAAARGRGNSGAMVRYSINLASCRLLLFEYRGALEA